MGKVRLLAVLLLAASTAAAQEAPPAGEARSTGLPAAVTWTFHFDAGWGTFGFANSLFTNPKEPVADNLSDQWFEGYVRPGLAGTYRLKSASEIYGRVSAAGERTYGSVPSAFGSDVSSFGPEDLFIGYRTANKALDVSAGRIPYKIGHGMLVSDGTSEGGSRGGYWTNARKAFELAAVTRVRAGPHAADLFYLDRDELPEADSGSRLWGATYEFTTGADESTTLGATYMKWMAHADVKPQRDGLNVLNLRAYTAPISAAPDLAFEFEFASERNGDALRSNAWTLQGGYQFSGARWKPELSYRYAFFQGDDPGTAANESFDPLFPGFHDWGTWWQGEIAGEYFLSNSNLKSHRVRAHVAPNDAVGAGLMFFSFALDQPTAFGPQVTSASAATEIDAYTDWKLNANFTLSVVGAFADPGKAVEQYTGRTKNFTYGMVYVAYAF